MVGEVVRRAGVDPELMADRIGAQAPLAIRLSKALFHAPREAHPLIDGLAQAILFETDDERERMTAFLERTRRA